jgi:TRAP-type uncharacterized transport system fused permease subunit
LIILVFVAYALLGPLMPFQILKHPGVDWRQFINNMYFPQEGIFGVTLWVVSTVVFHFVLFGVVAQRMGLGQFFVDNAMVWSWPAGTPAARPRSAWSPRRSSAPSPVRRSPIPSPPAR